MPRWPRGPATCASWTRSSRAASYVAGDGFTLADVPIGLSVNRWFMTPIPDRHDYPAVSAYYDRLSLRPAYLRHGRNGWGGRGGVA